MSTVSIKNWADLTEEEKGDLSFLLSQLSEYEATVELASDPEMLRILSENQDAIKQQVTALQKEKKQLRAKKLKELQELENQDKQDQQREYFRRFLEEHEIYYVASNHQYMEYFPDTGRWVDMLPQALYTLYGIRGPAVQAAFDDALDEFKRKKLSVECSFFDKGDRVLNLMRREHWLQPVDGTPHYMFNLLLRALGNDKPESVDHIEQLVYWKYTRPEEYKLPCLIIYGEGGVGKNTFVKEVLGTVFGQHQVLVADAKKVLGDFNGMVQGKTVVMIDEAIADKVDAEGLKRLVGNRTVDVNPKYGKQSEQDNTAWYLAGGNDKSGAVLLAGDTTDRRWSIIKVDKNIVQRLADDKGIPYDEAVTEYKKMEKVLSNPNEVAVWLHYLIEKWSHLEFPPVGLHKEDYYDLLETQKNPWEEICEFVFSVDTEFDYISVPVMYKLFQAYSRITNPGARNPMKQRIFTEHVKGWLRKNTSNIVYGKVKVRDPYTKRLTTANAFYKEGGTKTFDNNDHDYEYNENAVPFWEKIMEDKPLELIEGGKKSAEGENREGRDVSSFVSV